MMRFVLQKIKNKKWLNLCLLIGIILLSGMFSCHPMIEKGADQKLLQREFADYAQEKNIFPAIFSRTGNYDTSKYNSADSLYDLLDSYEAKWLEYVQVDALESQQLLHLNQSTADSSLEGRNWGLTPLTMRNIEEHITITKGQGLEADSGEVYGCIVSENTMDRYGMVLGEELTFSHITDKEGNPAVFVINGFFSVKSESGNYWKKSVEDMEQVIFISEDTMTRLLQNYNQQMVSYEDYLMLDYTQINWSNAGTYQRYILELKEADNSFSANFLSTLNSYENSRKNVATILWVLELPCLVLLLLFLYMITHQIIQDESGEIASLRSRGVTRGQILRFYFRQWLLLSLVGLVLGIFLGYGMGRLAAGTDAFLSFSGKNTEFFRMNVLMLPYGLIPCVIEMMVMLVLVWKNSRQNIVEQKGSVRYRKAGFIWERYFLDVLLLGVSLYLLYNYNRQKEQLVESVLLEQGLDPLIFLDASLFIFACGLLALRLCRYLVLLVKKIGQKHWSPAMYASFLQITRTFHKQGFIGIFLIMTIANGIFNANMARTVNENIRERIAYEVGCDARFQEDWTRHLYIKNQETSYYFDEPDFGRYEELVKEGICKQATKVIMDKNAVLTNGTRVTDGCILMGIHTKEFGETASLSEKVNDEHWYYALNALAENPDGVIISSNLAQDQQLEVGDLITYGRYGAAGEAKEEVEGIIIGQICAIVDGFPGYDRYVYHTGDSVWEEEAYLIVANYAQINSVFGVRPYQIWLSMEEGHDTAEVSEYLQEQGIGYQEWESIEELLEESQGSALIQITNGLFTMSFLISIFVCTIGFLMYHIMSMKGRELLFGIYRAMGMGMAEIRVMLINEQIFTTLLSILAGGAAGTLSTVLFVELISLVYLPQKHSIPLSVSVQTADVLRLSGALAAMVLLCFLVLRSLLKNMKIAQALKLGED